MASNQSVGSGFRAGTAHQRRPVHPGRDRPPAPMAWNRRQHWTVLAATAASILATALLLFAGG